jgi:hypothetical protein
MNYLLFFIVDPALCSLSPGTNETNPTNNIDKAQLGAIIGLLFSFKQINSFTLKTNRRID